MAKSLHDEALGKSGNKCLLRRFEASPTHLISIINVKLSHVLIYVCKLDTLSSFGGGRTAMGGMRSTARLREDWSAKKFWGHLRVF
jgi:hypothetical protein